MEASVKHLLACVMLGLALPLSAHAALDIGEPAPAFTKEAALGGSVFRYSLSESLRRGPVVLYFFPAAYSEGCSVEAHYFAEAIAEFNALGATVIGVSADDMKPCTKFSVQACQSKFPVASDESQERHEIVRRGNANAPGVCESHLLCDRTRRNDRLPLHEPQSDQARRKDARCSPPVEREQGQEVNRRRQLAALFACVVLAYRAGRMRRASPTAGSGFLDSAAAVAGKPAGATVQASLPGAGPDGFRLMPLGAYSLDARIELAQRAALSLDVQYYHIQNDKTGRLLLRNVRDAALRGVRVRLLVDDLYTTGGDRLFIGLAAFPNVEVRLFNPFCCGRDSLLGKYTASLADFGRLNHRMHNKLFIADSAIVVAGGRNIADEYFMRSTTGQLRRHGCVHRRRRRAAARQHLRHLLEQPPCLSGRRRSSRTSLDREGSCGSASTSSSTKATR